MNKMSDANIPSQPLTKIIKDKIEQDGPISFASFMALALYHPQFGYYCAPDIKIGHKGDFVTAPTLTPLFAACIAQQYSQTMDFLLEKNFLELGAGNGQFAVDFISSLNKLNRLPTHYYIYELSETLVAKQKKLLKAHHPTYFQHISWLKTLPINFNGMVFANEVLDALPTVCFEINGGEIFERRVTWQDEQFSWCLQSPAADLEKELDFLSKNYRLPKHYQSEICLGLTHFIESIMSSLNQGLVLFLDYGYGQQEYYHPQRQHGTLTGFYQHQQTRNPLASPGKQDITAHVDFTRVIELATSFGGHLLGFTSQSSFLLACGLSDLITELEKEMKEMDKINLHQAIKLLTLPSEMGEVVKVMAIGKSLPGPLLGFQFQDRRRDL